MRKQHCPFCNSLEVTHDFRGVDHAALLVAPRQNGHTCTATETLCTTAHSRLGDAPVTVIGIPNVIGI